MSHDVPSAPRGICEELGPQHRWLKPLITVFSQASMGIHLQGVDQIGLSFTVTIKGQLLPKQVIEPAHSATV